MPTRTVTADAAAAALAVAARPAAEVSSAEVKTAARDSLRWFAQLHPGRAVEVRVPPVAAVQALDGLRHTRGTPPNVVETDPLTWLGLVSGRIDWATAVADGRIRASGTRADLSGLLPVTGLMGRDQAWKVE